MSETRPDAVVVGGGVIGLAIAWRAARAGVQVTLVDPGPGGAAVEGAATQAAAGMLAPVTEAQYGEQPLVRLGLAAARRYPEFVGELEQEAGAPVGYRACGTLAVAFDGDDLAALSDLHAYHQTLGLRSTVLRGRECRRLEPLLAPEARGGLLVEDDHQVDNRMLADALLRAATRAGVRVRRERAEQVLVRDGRVAGVLLADGDRLAAGAVVLAAGCWSGRIGGLPDWALPPVRPVKGQILRLRVPPAYAPLLSRTVRGLVRGGHVYLVPREHGELVVGATMEELGFDTQVTAGGAYELLRDARTLVPAITELPWVECRAGLRPGSPDNAPLIGASELAGLVVATGHHRNGILLTPVTADAIAHLLATGETPELVRPFAPDRFAGQGPPGPPPAPQPEHADQAVVR
jgi:glycine oxidase